MHYVVSNAGYSGSYVPFGANLVYAVGDSALWVGHSSTPTILGYAPDGTRIGEVELLDFRQPVDASLAGLEGEFPFQIPEQTPYFGQAFIDAEGHLWVGAYRPPGGASAQEWKIFSLAGRPLASLTSPAGLEVLSVEGDLLVGTTRDDLDVLRVMVHRIDRPASAP